MKTAILTIFIFAQIVVIGQTKPDQQTIPEFVLTGKTFYELKLMRNEIFARYGYIFKSTELTEHFSQKQWYKPTVLNVENRLTEIDKENINLILKFENRAKDQSNEPVYSNTSQAYQRILYDDEIQGNVRKSRDVTFQYHCKFGTLKKTVERTYFGGEETPTVVYAETAQNEKPFWETTKYFNDLKFSCSYYRAINYGCCGAENYNELYNYNNNEPFLTFNKKYFHVDIPNSKIEMFIGYNHDITERDSMIIATLYISTLEGVVSSVSFVSRNKVEKKEIYWYFTPNIELRTTNDKNKIARDGLEIQLWSSNFAKTLLDVNGFSIFIEFVGDSSGKKAAFEIPIVNGRFYGADKQNTKITVNLE